MEPYVSMSQHIFFNHIGQLVGGILAIAGYPEQPLRQGPHHISHRRKETRNDQRELPVQIHQVANQCHQRQRATGRYHQCADHEPRTGLNFVNDGVGQRAGVLVGE